LPGERSAAPCGRLIRVVRTIGQKYGPTAWYESGDADSGATPALYVSPRLRGDGAVGVDPHSACADGDSWHGCLLVFTISRHERVVQSDLIM
jgi:hypothetical protein